MNSIKNFKGIRADLDEFDAADNKYLNMQYKLFRKRLLRLYQDMNSLGDLARREEQYHELLKVFLHIEEEDKSFIKETMNAVADNQIREMEIASLLLANRLFTQGCRLQVFGLKDLLLSNEQIKDFDRALDMKELIEEEKARESKSNPDEEQAAG
jgi:phosphate:Na+ symporter